ncbi:MAG: UpxY family transcription antiterminator [Terracidiphilus sp.]|nr:UpxY family transcription antiterminator [Terracidiphilus sp.]
MSLEETIRGLHGAASLDGAIDVPALERKWYAVFTLPQNEKAVVKQLAMREVESFLPTYETVRLWKNRQRVRIELPLFPTYLFVHINIHERIKVLQSPGVLQIVGNGRTSIPLTDAEIDFLRSGFCGKKLEPYRELVAGQKVCIKSGPLQGLKGVLVKQKNGFRFVLSLDMINQHASVEVDAESLEPLVD